MKLFVANCTRQNQEIHFRHELDEEGGKPVDNKMRAAMRMTIPPGRQAPLGGIDFAAHVQVDAIVDQLRPFGITAVSEVPSVKTRTIPLVWNVGEPVKADMIRRVMDFNDGIRVNDGHDRRVKAAVATNDIVQKAVQNVFDEAGLEREAKQDVDVEFEQLDESAEGGKKVEEGFRVRPDAPTPKPKSSKSKPSRRRN